MTELNLPTYTVPNDVYASFFYRATGTAVVEKRPLPTTPKQYPPNNDLSTPSVGSPTPMAIDVPTSVVGPPTTEFLDTPFLDDSQPMFGDVNRIQVIEIQMPTDAGNYPAFTTSTSPLIASYTAITQSSGDGPISPIAIVGLATGGAISVVVALTMAIIMCARRRRSGRHRQNSITSQERPMEVVAPTCKIEPYASKEQVNELPSSLKSPPSGSRTGSNRSRHSKHITWKDQVFSDQSFMTLPPLPPHPASISMPILARDRFRIGEDETREPGSSGFVLYLPDDRIPYRYFSSPTLGADRTSIYSSMPPSPICVSALSPIPSYLFPTPHNRLQRPQIPTSQYHSIISSSSELNDYYATITCTSIHSFLPGGGRRSLSDSFAIQEATPPSSTRKSSIRYSGGVRTFHPSFSHPKSPAPLPKSGFYNTPMALGRTRTSTFIVAESIENDGASISSVSSTGSSILNYRIRGTPRKLLTDGLLVVENSSPHSSAFDDSPPSGGLTSPSHRPRHSELELPLAGYTLNDPESPRTPGPGIGIALSPPLFGTSFVASSSTEHIFQDVFVDGQDIDTQSPTLEEISTRHFSCSMPTRPRFTNRGSSPPPYPQVIPPSPTRAHVFPDFCGRDSPTLPRDCSDLGTESQISECDILEIIPPKLPRRTRGGIESSYSPTLSMVNFYTMGNRADSRFSSVNFFTPFSSNPFPTPYHARSSSVPSPMSPTMNYGSQSQDEEWKRESLIKEYPPNWPEERFGPLSLSLGSIAKTAAVGTDDSTGNKGGRYNSRFFSTTDAYLIVDERVGENEEDEEWGGVGLEETKVRRTESID